jgi:hypothetical protein
MAMNLDALLRIKANVLGENNIRRLGNSLQGLKGQAKNAALGFNNLKGAVAGFGAAIAGSAIVAGLGAIVKSAVNLGDELGKMSARTGVAQGALIGLRNAAALSDVENEKLQAGLTRLNVAMVAAADGNAAAEAKFKRLGISVKNAAGEVRPTDQVFKDLGDRFKDMPNGAEKAAAAVSIFGKAGADLIPLLNGGREAMEAFNFELSDEFAARSELFNDTLTILGFKTEGFKLQLADALLPALQSILEVFGDLFNTDQDWTALFKVIEGVIRGIAVAIYTVVKAVDILIKNIVAAAQAATQAFAGDFAGAFKTITTRVSSGFAEAKQSIADLNKLAFGSAASPGTGRRTGGRNMALDTSAADTAAAAAAKKAASEQERILEKRVALTKKSEDLQEKLRRSVEDTRDAFDVIGASPTQKLGLERDTALTENKRIVDDFKKSIKSIGDEAVALGGKLDLKIFDGLIEQLERANTELTDQEYLQGLKDLLPSVAEYDAKIAEVGRGKTELTEVEKLNAQVNLLQLDILAATNPALAEHVRLLRERATALDTANKDKPGKSFKDKIEEYAKSMDDLGAVLGDAAVNAFGKLENSLTKFVTTGKLQFQEFVASIISDLAKLAVKFAVVNTVKAILGFEDGGIMTRSGPAPLKKYASGGIANSPQLAMFGEGSTPEAYVPLPDGRRIPVAMQGGSGGSTTVNVSVDAKGTSVQGNSGQGEQLGRAISQAVQAELIKQRRPGGILAMA